MIDEKTIREAVILSLKKIREINLVNAPPTEPVASEKIKQSVVSKKIDSAGVRKKASTKGEGEEVEEEDDADSNEDIRKKFDKNKSGELKKDKDDKFSYDIPETFPKDVAFKDVLKQLNFVRSGASAKDTEVKKGLMQYFDNLKSDEKRDLLSMLSGFATIMNKAGDPSDAPTPTMVDKKVKKKSEEEPKSDIAVTPAKTSNLSPIIVGEAAKKDKELKVIIENK